MQINNIMDTMFLKRFCLPSNTDLDEFKNNNMVASKCICGNYFHVSCVFQGKYNILSIGMNKYADVDGTMPSIHAEHDAILRLPCLKNKNKKKKVKINLLVIRFLKTYTLANSKPCLNCIQNMIEIPKKRGYKIEDIYYSENNNTIIKTNINKLLNEKAHHITSYYRNNRYLHRKHN
jgi:hypothetical protein